MSNILQFPDKKRIRERQNLELLGNLLQQAYDLGMEPDPEMDIWLKTAQNRLDGYNAAREWHEDYLNQ